MVVCRKIQAREDDSRYKPHLINLSASNQNQMSSKIGVIPTSLNEEMDRS